MGFGLFTLSANLGITLLLLQLLKSLLALRVVTVLRSAALRLEGLLAYFARPCRGLCTVIAVLGPVTSIRDVNNVTFLAFPAFWVVAGLGAMRLPFAVSVYQEPFRIPFSPFFTFLFVGRCLLVLLDTLQHYFSVCVVVDPTAFPSFLLFPVVGAPFAAKSLRAEEGNVLATIRAEAPGSRVLGTVHDLGLLHCRIYSSSSPSPSGFLPSQERQGRPIVPRKGLVAGLLDTGFRRYDPVSTIEPGRVSGLYNQTQKKFATV